MKVMRQGDRNAKLNFILDIGNLNFPEPGKYTFNIKNNNEIIGDCAINVKKTAEGR